MPLLKQVWAGAADALRLAQRIWILGYSMPPTDKFFRYLLAIALQKNTSLDEVVIVNENREHCDQIAILFRALDDRGKVFRQPGQIGNYVGSTLGFQSQLRQVYRSQNFAW